MKQKEQNHPNGCFTCDEYKKGYEAGRLNGFTAGYNKAMKEEEQMKALRRAVNKLAKSDVTDSVRLSIMYDNLKKRM